MLLLLTKYNFPAKYEISLQNLSLFNQQLEALLF